MFIEVDMSQAEARVVAYLAEETRLIELFNGGGDVYKQVAAWIFNKDVDDVSGDERSMAKKLVHASNYGIGARAFAYHSGVRESEARLLLGKYFTAFPHIKTWQLTIQARLGKSRVMTTALGRKRTFFGRWGEQLFREAYAFEPQSVVADVLGAAMIRFDGADKLWKYAEFMLQVHDSFLVQTDDDSAGIEIVKGMIRSAFDYPIYIKGRRLVIPIEIKVGSN